MILGLGESLPLRALGKGGSIALLTLLLVLVISIRYWPLLVERIERWWRSR